MAGAPPRSAELDFADVFGGPPRRASGNERRSLRGSLDSSSFRSSAPRARSGDAAEAPVFGDRGSGDRRRHLGEEFYRDIFPGSEAALPRRAGAGDWGDVFGRPASPGSMTPPRSSFSMNFNLGADSSMLTSPTRETSNRNDDGTSYTDSIPPSPNSHMNDYLAQETSQQNSRKNTFSGHRYPFLSRFRSQSGDKKNPSNHVSSVESESEGTPLSMESIMASNNFHFSFYKWAGKGAMLVLPAAMEEKDAGVTRLKSFPQVVVQGVDLIDEHDSMSNATDTSKNQTDYEDSKSGKYSTVSATQEGPVPLFSDDDYMQGMKHSTSYSKNDVSSDSLSAKSSRLPSGERSRSSRVKGKVKGFMKMFSPEASPKSKGAPEVQDQTSIVKNECKTELRDKFTLFSYEASEGVKINVPSTMSEVQGRMKKPVLTRNSKMDATSERNEANPDGIKQSTGYSKDGVQSDSLSTKSSRLPPGERSRSNRVKGKMKDFVKIFSLEGSPKRKGAPEALDQTSSAKNGSKTELQDKFILSSFEACEDVKTIQNNQSTFIDVPSTISEVQESMEKSILTRNSKMEGKMGITSERNESVPDESIGSGKKDKLESTIHHEEIYVEDLDGFLVEHITEDHLLHNYREKDQIKIAESKIREWSRGKERNIRSLLSTLQYVLWPESGWKPIPLVDVIEGAAVKKAYQKALLCLHPDKLQQRGAAMHHKYIAEKVFDILQESWKEFNSVTFG